jgi:hypothetical protein
MTISALVPVSFTSFYDPGNGAVKQASLYFYRAGTLDPITVYTTSALAIPHPLPVLTTGYGRVPPIWVGELPDPGYRIRVFDQYSVLIEDIDNIPGAQDPTADIPITDPADPTTRLQTGDLIFAMSNSQPRAGAVLANGKSVAKTGSVNAPGGRANDDTHALFLWLWGQDLYNMLPVTPSRGSTAEGDWTAGKGIATPDLQGRVLVGMDAMGSTATNRLTGVPMLAGLPNQMGARGGEALHVNLLAEIPNHKHDVAVGAHAHQSTVPAHGHTLTSINVGNAGAHTHIFTGTAVPNHFHDYNSTGALSPGTGGAFGTQVNNIVTAGANTSSAGGHTPAGTIPAAPDHTHTFSAGVSVDPAHVLDSTIVTPSLAETAKGGDGAHNNTSLFLACAVYIKL